MRHSGRGQYVDTPTYSSYVFSPRDGEDAGGVRSNRIPSSLEAAKMKTQMKTRILAIIVVLSVFSSFALAQQNPLVGTWERVFQADEQGNPSPNPYMLVIFSSDGVFTQINIAKNRPRVDKPLSQLTNEEFRARFTGVQAVYGTYSVTGDRITRNVIGALNPNNEGEQLTSQFKVEGDTMTALDPKTKTQARFRRVRNGSLSPR